MKFQKLLILIGILILSAISSVQAMPQIEIDQAWARPSPPGAPSAGFMLVKNNSAVDEVLLDVTGDFAKRLELHRSMKVDGVMKMIQQKDGIVIPAGGEILFKPGSYHLMFMGLDKPFVKGETYEVDLHFKNAGKIHLKLPVTDMP